MTDIIDLIEPLNKTTAFGSDAMVRVTGAQSSGAVDCVQFGHRPDDWVSPQNGCWKGVWVRIGRDHAWLTVEEARALSIGIMQAATRLQNGEPG